MYLVFLHFSILYFVYMNHARSHAFGDVFLHEFFTCQKTFKKDLSVIGVYSILKKDISK